MKSLPTLRTASLVLAALNTMAWAETFPIFEDAAGSPTAKTITAAAGKAKTIAISGKSSAFINFAVSSGQGDPVFNIDPATVTGARLVIFLAKASSTGTITISNLLSGFTESSTNTIPTPTIGASLGTIPLASFTPSLNADYFITDITAQVKAWLTNFNPNTEFGIAITSDGTATATLASKEGAGSGHPAFIELDINKGGGTVSGTTAMFTGEVTAGSFSSTGAVSGTTGTFSGALSGTTGTFSGALTGTTGTFTDALSGTTGTFTGALTGTTGTFSGALGIGGNLSAAGNIVLSSAANRTVSVAPEATNATAGHSLTIKAGNAISGSQAQTGGDLILEAGNGFNISIPGADGGDLILRSGPNSISGTDNGGDIIFQVGKFNSTFGEVGRILDNGNFGIGTATASAKLEVNGDLRVGNSTPGHFNVNTGGFNDVTGTFKARAGDLGTFNINNSNGNFTAGFANPATVDANTIVLTLAGNAEKPNGGSWAATSDLRLKKDIVNLDGALDSLLRLRSVTFEYKDPASIHELPGRHTGFIAQEVEKIFPEWVGTKANGFKCVGPVGFESLAVQALRELRAEKDAEIAALKQKVAALEALDAAREARLTRLESALDAAPVRPVRASLDFK